MPLNFAEGCQSFFGLLFAQVMCFRCAHTGAGGGARQIRVEITISARGDRGAAAGVGGARADAQPSAGRRADPARALGGRQEDQRAA
eukprot:1731711-Pleurochrysis_carterae.AAC.2